MAHKDVSQPPSRQASSGPEAPTQPKAAALTKGFEQNNTDGAILCDINGNAQFRVKFRDEDWQVIEQAAYNLLNDPAYQDDIETFEEAKSAAISQALFEMAQKKCATLPGRPEDQRSYPNLEYVDIAVMPDGKADMEYRCAGETEIKAESGMPLIELKEGEESLAEALLNTYVPKAEEACIKPLPRTPVHEALKGAPAAKNK